MLPKINSANILTNLFVAESGGVNIPISVYSSETQKHKNKTPIALIVYGGGVDFTQQELDGMKLALFERGFRAVGFNFRGHIHGGPNFYATGLHTRIADLRAVVKKIRQEFPSAPITVIAVSMGGYVATFLNPGDVKNLVLVAAAAYHPDVVSKKLNFNPKDVKSAPFRKLIQAKDSWKKSDSFKNIRKFIGVPLLVIRFDQDTVVSPEISEKYFREHPGPKKMTALPYPHNGNFMNQMKVRDIVATVVAWLYSVSK